MSMAEDSKTLSDEQVAQLNTYEPVQLARTNVIKTTIAFLKGNTPELLEKAQEAGEEYDRIFQERLKEVIEHPPQPKSANLTQTDRLKGFKK